MAPGTSQGVPTPKAYQWAGRVHTSVIDATAHWLSIPHTSGAEVDLRTAYDSVVLRVAYTANLYRGVSNYIASTLFLAWSAVRTCCVLGVRAVPIRPCCGLPQGDPSAGDTLTSVLIPWDTHIHDQCRSVHTWAFVDDRTLGAPTGPAHWTKHYRQRLMPIFNPRWLNTLVSDRPGTKHLADVTQQIQLNTWVCSQSLGTLLTQYCREVVGIVPLTSFTCSPRSLVACLCGNG